MFYIVMAVIFVVLALAALAAWRFGKSPRDSYGFNSRKIGRNTFFVMLAALVVWTLAFSFTTVDARAVAIQTGFGRYMSTMDNGLHLKAPWSNTEQFTTILQTADLEGNAGVPVTFAGGGSGTVNATVRWRISDSKAGAERLWSKYRTFESVQENLILRASRDSILNIANDYLPNDARTKQDVIAAKVKDNLESKMKAYGVEIDSVSVLSMPLDPRTQASLDKIVSSNNDIQRAEADQKRARIDAETVKIRNRTGALSPEANARYCLDVVNNWDVKKNGQLPATFNCALNGDKTPVIVGK